MTRRPSKIRRSRGVEAARAGDIAVIGLGGRFPQARNPDEFWSNVLNGRSAVTAAPEQRSQLVEGADEPVWGAFIDDVDCFDASFFAISPKEAQLMDPQQRLLLEVVWHTLEDARIKPSAVAGSKTGVFIGACNVDYGELIDARTRDAGMFSTTGVFASILANRISYAFDWRGPSLTVDTACSSSLVAVHLAAKALQAGECDLAIAGGVNVCWTQRRFVAFSDAGMLSRDGHCRTFDAGANGYVRGEGVGAVLLKPLERAVRDGNRIYGVIKGSAVNHGGKNRGLTVVSPAQQAQLLMDAYRAAGVRPEEVGYIEAHAIGSALADPIEFLALKQAFRSLSSASEHDTSSTKHCAVGSVKANIGHLEAAAGIGSLIKVLLMLKHKVIPPCAGLSSLNPLIKPEDSPFYIPTSSSPWSVPSAVPRVAGVSSFGFGGACAHVVVAEHVHASPRRYAAASSEPQLIVLSARDVDRLRAWSGSLLEWLRSSEVGTRVRLDELAYALQAHREELEERLALVVSSVESLIAALDGFVRGELPARSYRGRVSKGKKPSLEATAAEAEANDLERCAERWAQGAGIEGARLHEGRSLRPIDLPLYPFAKQRYWIEGSPVTRAPASVTSNHEVRRYVEDFLSRSLALPPSCIECGKDLQELGVDSLLERRLMQGLARTFGVSLHASDLAAHPSIDALIELVERQLGSADNGAQPAPESSRSARELSEVQKGLWTLQRMSPASSAYNIPFAVRCLGVLDSRAFAQAHEWLLSTHPLLRSVVVEEAGTLHFHDRGVRSVPIIEERITSLSSQELQDRLSREASIPFDLAKGPLLRVTAWSSPTQTLLLFVVHHIIFDARSLEVLLADLFDVYARIVSGKPLAAKAVAASWDDFVSIERGALAEGQAHLAYWQKQLGGSLPVLELPTDRPRGSGDTERAATHSWKLDATRSSAIRRFCRERRVNPPALFLAAWQLLLSRYTRETDVIVGVPTYGRPDERFDELIGCFINMIAVRTDVDEEQALGAFLQRVQSTLSAGLDHAAYPFPSLVRDLKLARPGSSPVFQVAFEYQNASLRGFDWQRASAGAGLNLEPVEGLHQQGEYECVLEVLEQPDAFAVNLKYDAQLFATESIGRIATGYTQLMDELLSRPDSRLCEYSLLSSDDTRQLLLGWNATEQAYPTNACVHDLFEQQSLRSPDAVAVSCDGASMTYRELHDRSDTFARFLQQQGVAGESLVALCIERSTRMMVALLGILKSGAAYVPLDPDYPAERLRYMVRDSKAKLIVTQTSLLSRLQALQSDATLIAIDDQWGEIESVAANRTLRRTDGAQHLAYVIYTSGSTGQPKGVMIPHQALTNFLLAVQPTAGVKRGDSLLAVTTLSFDIAGLELYLPLLGGATCVIATARESRDAQQLSQLLLRVRPALMQATPATWSMLFQAGWRNSERVRIFCGGEALTLKLREQFVATGSEAWNLFGPTETTIWSTIAPIVANAPITIGKPLANTQIYIVDRHRRLTPVGVPGELCIAGDGLARGYLNRAELTARKFIDNPFRPGTKLYCTGDLARWTNEGTIEYLGRMDEQVKVRGYRIELGEIEHAVRNYPMIRDAAAVVSDQVGHPQLIVYYTAQSQSAVQSVALREHLRRTLPDYMVPTRLIEMATLPLTPNGKLDRKSLARRDLAPEASNAAASAIAVVSSPQPRAVEQQVLSIWRELLKNDAVGMEEGFFDAGGDSLLAVALAARIEQAFGCTFPAAAIFRYPTVRSIGAHLSATNRVAAQVAEESSASSSALPDYYEHSVAVIGISCHFPGAADHRAFWENLRRGVESIEIVPRAELGARDSRYVSARAAIDGKDLFDAEFFRIPPRDAQVMDPQMRQLLMHSWKAVEDAGYVPRRLPKTGVFMSASTNFYQAQSWPSGSAIAQDADQYVSWVLAQSGTIPTLVSHKLGLTGPSLFVHSNCSSSLVALHAAYQSLSRGEATCALVGAATLFPAATHGYLHQPGMNFSSDGHLRAFDADADGMIGSEGVAVLLLKQANAALADGDHIYALLRGVGVNNDGAAKAGFYAPSVEGQSAVIEQVLDTTGIHPESISYIEAHGTGTKLGDPVEFAALRQVYEQRTSRKQFCGLGSVKTNVGHLDTAAGLAGCIKVALSLEQGELPASLHFKRANAAISFDDSPFYVVAESMQWPAGSEPRRAAISSFGIGGTNTHAIFEQAPTPAAASAIAGPYIVPLSARTPERLRAYAQSLLDFLARAEPVDFAAVAYTLQVGREAMNSRVAFVVSGLEELAAQLLEFLNDRPDGKYLRGEIAADSAASHPPSYERLIERRDLQRLGELWVTGAAIDWSLLYAGSKPRRLSLPAYPFAPERHWLEPVAAVANGDAVGSLHPLLQRNTSILGRQRFSSVFNGDEFFLADHVIHGRRVLPGVAYLEMIRAAVAQATDMPPDLATLRFKNVVWISPIVVDAAPAEFHAELIENSRGGMDFRVYSLGANDEETLHAQGAVELAAFEPVRVDLQDEQRHSATRDISPEQCYGYFLSGGTIYGDRLRGLKQIRAGEGRALVELELPASVRASAESFVLHPSLLDSAIQSTLYFGHRAEDGLIVDAERPEPTLPFSVDEVEVHGSCPERMWATVRFSDRGSGAALAKLDIDLVDATGNVCVRLRSFARRAFDPVVSDRSELMLCRPTWVEHRTASESAIEPFEHYIVLCGLGGERLAEQLRTAQRCNVLQSDAHPPAAQFRDYASQLLGFIQERLRARPTDNVLVQVVIPADPPLPGLGGLSGLLKTAEREHSKLLCQLIAIESSVTPSALAEQLASCARSHQYKVLELRASGLRRRSWEQIPPGNEPPGKPWKNNRVYLITGGAGAVGQLLAREIVSTAPNATVILAGRTHPSELALRDLRASGSNVSFTILDVADRAAVEHAIQVIQREHGALNGVIHCAGTLRDNYIVNKSSAELADVLAPKVDGLVNLDEATAALPLDFFVAFASISGAHGNAGQADYAAANAFMDDYLRYRETLRRAGQRQGRGVSFDWPLWRDGGMQVDVESTRLMSNNTGITPMSTRVALDAFYRGFNAADAQVLVLHGDLARMQQRGIAPIHVARAIESTAVATTEVEQETSDRSAAMLEKIRNLVTRAAAAVLKMSPGQLEPNAELSKFGFDSVSFIALVNALNRELALDLTPTIFFEYPTIGRFAEYLAKEHPDRFKEAQAPVAKATPSPPAAARTAPVAVRSAPQQVAFKAADPSELPPVAIIGMSGVFPQAEDIQAFWRNLLEGRDCISEIPPSRWDWRAIWGDPRQEPNKSNVKWGGFVPGLEDFDPLFFGISPREAESMDPQQRLLMNAAWHAIEDAGYSAQSLSGSNMGVFVGIGTDDYSHRVADAQLPIEGFSATGTACSLGANRLSFLLDVHGPSEAIDTACSSSLVAIHRAHLAIASGTCDTALVGGVNAIVMPRLHVSFNKAGMLSEDGHCKTFSSQANGYVRGEGVGLLLLKKLSDAERDGDHIYAVIRGSAENHGGRANSLTAPNPKAQAALLRSAYERSGIDARTVTYIEAHGTGTELGDPIEIEGLKSAFDALYDKSSGTSRVMVGSERCGIGSVKSNIGHLELAAGVAGVIKVVLQMKHRLLVKSLNSEPLNPYIRLTGSPFHIVTENQPWTAPLDVSGKALPRRAGVSSFGFGGSNAHVVLEEYDAPELRSVRGERAPVAIVLSARDGERLKERATQLLQAIEAQRCGDDDLESLAYTLQIGRDAMDSRLGFVARSLTDMAEKLRAAIDDAPSEGIHRGQAKRDRETLGVLADDVDLKDAIARWVERGKLDQVIGLWVKGFEFDWRRMYGNAPPLRLSLPTYPFARKRCWIDLTAPVQPVPELRPTVTLATLPDVPIAPLAIAAAPTVETVAPIVNPSIATEDLESALRAMLADVLHMSPSEIERDSKFVDIGLDSITGVEWTQRLAERFALPLKATLVYDHPSLGAFSRFIAGALAARGEAPHPRKLTQVTDNTQILAKETVLPPVPAEDTTHIYRAPAEAPAAEGGPAVAVTALGDGIVRITMQDRVGKNTFTPELVRGLSEAFATVRNDLECKVVILTGYDTYFCCGGSREGLLAIQRGDVKFTDVDIYTLALECQVPVIAAMQGHAIGAGWALGMFSDFVVMSRESTYTSNYMSYGFTPGAGATLIFPEKLGLPLAQEILFTATRYSGEDLERKGVPFPVLAREDVVSHAIQLARKLAESPRPALIALKELMTSSLRKKVASTLAHEQAQHNRTFVNQPEVRARIESVFGERQEPAGEESNAVAIVGMAGQFPKADTLQAFWANLRDGVDCIGEVPASRWSIEEYYDADPDAPGKTQCKWLGSLERADEFDPLFFNIPPASAVQMDPQQRLFLQNCWHCIEDAGIEPASLSGSRCGVYVGCVSGDYSSLLNEHGLTAHGFMGGSNAILAARISYLLNLKGPSVALDTSCSSSLVAIAQACDSLIAGANDVALAGGVFVLAGPSTHIMTSKSGMLSADGRCFSFDHRANGFVPGEGVGVLLLKRLSDARRAGDPIHAILRGWGVNQDGSTNGITAPSADSQCELERDVYRRFGIDPRSITLVEAHGTGTPLGDPIEVEALIRSFGQRGADGPHCALGSVKSNVGHLVAAAGVAGVIKAVLALEHRQLPPTINFERLNPHIDLDASPFYINTELRPWVAEENAPRRACVSSFGFSGTNAHIVVEEYLGDGDAPLAQSGPVIIALSAKTKISLREGAARLREFVERQDAIDLPAVAYTLQVGRAAFPERLAFVASSRTELLNKLRDYIDAEASPGIVTRRTQSIDAGELGDALDAWRERRDATRLLKYWMGGAQVDWRQLYEGQARPRRVHLPGYAFARQSYWLPSTPRAAVRPGASAGVANSVRATTGRRTCFLHKQWVAANVERRSSRGDGEIAILSTDGTRELAIALTRRFKSASVLYPSRFAELSASGRYAGVIDLIGCGASSVEWQHWLQPMRDLVAHRHRLGLSLLCVTWSLETFRNDVINIAGADRVGLYRMLQLEYRQVSSRHVDLDAATDTDQAVELIAAEYEAEDEHVEICYRQGERYAARLAEVDQGLTLHRGFEFPSDRVLWITGGTRGLGMLCARHFVRHHGVKKLVLTGREALPPRDEWTSYKKQHPESGIARKIRSIEELEHLGARVEVAALSLSDATALAGYLQQIKRTLGDIGGVLHCAGTAGLDDPAFIHKSQQGAAEVMEPKIGGLNALLEVFAPEQLKFFVLFSSVAAAVPKLAAGHSDYALANAYMDYVAQAKPNGLPLVSIQWPSWQQTGIGEAATAAYRESGLRSLSDEEGLALLDAVLANDLGPVILPAIVDDVRWRVEDWMKAPSAAVAVEALAVDTLRDRAQAWLADLLADVLKIPRAELDVHGSFGDYGVDSILLTQLLRRIGRQLEVELDPASPYEHASLAAFTDWLIGKHEESLRAHLPGDTVSIPEKQPVTAPIHSSATASIGRERRVQDIAVVGMSCRLPGAENVDAYWDLLAHGRVAISPVPAERWGYQSSYVAGLLPDIYHFDPGHFFIRPEDASAMDPQALLVLEESLRLCHAAGYESNALKGRPVGVYLGARSQHQPADHSLDLMSNPVLALGQNYLAANVSRFFDLRGPSVVIDTACSSSLVAMQMAVQALQSGEIDSAIVGGVNVLTSDLPHQLFQRRGLLSRSGEFHTFDRRASGVVLGEGVGLVMLKTLEQALRDGDDIQAIVKGIAVNNDGRTAGPATPNISAQKAVMQRALAISGIEPAQVSYIEANASGSEVTDLLELKAIDAVYAGTQRPLGSVKPNIGHTLCAEGIAAFIKVVLMLKRGRIAPFLSGGQPLEHHDWNASSVRVVRTGQDWQGESRVGALNCFADGGTNAHVIVQSRHEESVRNKRLPLSAPSLQRRDVRTAQGRRHHVPEVAALASSWWERNSVELPQEV